MKREVLAVSAPICVSAQVEVYKTSWRFRGLFFRSPDESDARFGIGQGGKNGCQKRRDDDMRGFEVHVVCSVCNICVEVLLLSRLLRTDIQMTSFFRWLSLLMAELRK